MIPRNLILIPLMSLWGQYTSYRRIEATWRLHPPREKNVGSNKRSFFDDSRNEIWISKPNLATESGSSWVQHLHGLLTNRNWYKTCLIPQHRWCRGICASNGWYDWNNIVTINRMNMSSQKGYGLGAPFTENANRSWKLVLYSRAAHAKPQNAMTHWFLAMWADNS